MEKNILLLEKENDTLRMILKLLDVKIYYINENTINIKNRYYRLTENQMRMIKNNKLLSK